MIKIIILTLCVLIEIYHLIYRNNINNIREIIENAFKKTKEIDINDKELISNTLDNISISMIHKYFTVIGIELFYWFLIVILIFVLGMPLGIFLFLLMLFLSILSQYWTKLFQYKTNYKSKNIYDTMDSIFCIIIYLILLIM